MTILDDIITYKKAEVRTAKANTPAASLEALVKEVGVTRNFTRALQASVENGFGLIAEIKKASPSKGLIREDFRPAELAEAYENGGATCLSVLTDQPSFMGHPDYLRQARNACRLPVLRKDFMVDPYQVLEARAWGADCILLIMAALDTAQMLELEDAARLLGLHVLAEVHDEAELEQALQLRTRLIGVNNRDLRTFETDLNTTIRLAAHIPDDRLPISESGLYSHQDLAHLADHGVKAFLIGESLMREDDVTAATRAILQGPLSA